MDLEKEGRMILCPMIHGDVSRSGIHDPYLCGEA